MQPKVGLRPIIHWIGFRFSEVNWKQPNFANRLVEWSWSGEVRGVENNNWRKKGQEKWMQMGRRVGGSKCRLLGLNGKQDSNAKISKRYFLFMKMMSVCTCACAYVYTCAQVASHANCAFWGQTLWPLEADKRQKSILDHSFTPYCFMSCHIKRDSPFIINFLPKI